MIEDGPKFGQGNKNENADLEPGNFSDSMSDAEIAERNDFRVNMGYRPLRRATKEEERLYGVGWEALTKDGQRKYSMAVITKSGKVFCAANHEQAIKAAQEAGEIVDKRGWATKDGRFLNLLDVAREEMKEQHKKGE